MNINNNNNNLAAVTTAYTPHYNSPNISAYYTNSINPLPQVYASATGSWGIVWAEGVRLWPSILFALFFIWFRKTMKSSIAPPIATRLCGIKAKGRISRFSYQLWLFLFYFLSSIIGYIVIADEAWTAFPLGVTQQAALFLPHNHYPATDLQLYYSYAIGFYAAELYAIFVETRRSDFLEYVVHHIVTLLLIGFSWMGFEYRIGTYIIFIHDASDVYLCAAKLLHYSKARDFFINTMFTAFVVAFIFFRLWCLPVVTYAIFWLGPNVKQTSNIYWCLAVLLGIVLQGLHLFWFSLIIKMIVRLTCGVGGDVRSESDEDNNNNNTDGENNKKNNKNMNNNNNNKKEESHVDLAASPTGHQYHCHHYHPSPVDCSNSNNTSAFAGATSEDAKKK